MGRDPREAEDDGWLHPALCGAMNGLVANASLIAGVSGAGAAAHIILLTGLAGLVAGAFSVGTGAYFSTKSQYERALAKLMTVSQSQYSRAPRSEERQLTSIFVRRGVDEELAAEVARQIFSGPGEPSRLPFREEPGIDPDDLPIPWTAAGTSFAGFAVGALLPLLPYLLGFPFLLPALVLAAVAAFVGGAATAWLTGRPVLMDGLGQFGGLALATAVTFLIGNAAGVA